MSLHHYLPATFLASFSSDTSTPERRDRLLHVGNKQAGSIFRAPAAKVGAKNNLYTLANATYAPQMVNNIWTEYENSLNDAITRLIAGKLDAKTWVRVLVPFVACMLVRGPDFNRRFGQRMEALGLDAGRGREFLTKDNTNMARVMELQRLLSPVAVAKWVVIRFGGQGSLITNDLGYAPFVNQARKESGMAVPLGPSHTLAVIPRNAGRVAVVQAGRWVPNVKYADSPPDDREGLNRAVASAAQRFVFGPDEDIVGEWLREVPTSPSLLEPGHLGFIGGRMAVAHEFNWHRLTTAVERDPLDGEPWDFSLDLDNLSQAWTPPVLFPTNLVEFPSALRREESAISAEFYDPSEYFIASGVSQS